MRNVVIFGIAAALIVVGALFATLKGGLPLRGYVISWASALVGVGIWSVTLWAWWRARKAVAFTTRHGLAVILNGFPVIQDAIEKETEKLFLLLIVSREDVLKRLEGVRVIWRAPGFSHRTKPGEQLMGLAIPSRNLVYVAWIEQGVAGSALIHELRHLFGFRHEDD